MKKKFRFYFFGYRDEYFWNSYGPIVRDLMICKTLSNFKNVDKITFFNRPVSLYERILGIKKITRHSKQIYTSKIKRLLT